LSARPAITVVTICRNVLPLLQGTVESVLAQGYPALEYWIVDGDSTDGTKAYLETLSGQGVRWVSEPDDGIADAMNKGARLASGEWVAHLHAGDAYLPGALETVARHAAANPEADLLCGSILKREERAVIVYGCAPERLRCDMTINHPATWTKRVLFETHGGFDRSFFNAMDYEFFLRLQCKGARFAVMPETVARMAGGGQSEISLWTTLMETHRVRRRWLTSGWERSLLYVVLLYVRGTLRRMLQAMGLGRFVAWWRRRFAASPKP